MPLSQYNQVVVRVWTSKNNVSIPGQFTGHISLEIDTDPALKRYVSFWPADGEQDAAKDSGFFKPVPSENKVDLAADVEAEGRHPEYTAVLYSLNTLEMNKKYDAELTNKKGWAGVGNSLLSLKTAHSCASMAYTVLIAGGIKNLLAITTPSHSRLSSITTPDKLAEAVQEAKRAELNKYPETKDYDKDSSANGNDASWWPCQLL